MQEVWGSNPHSSTQVKDIIRNPDPQGSGAPYSSKVPQRRRREASYANSDKAPPPMRAAGMVRGGRTLRRPGTS
jgi:hypothetical protein